MFNFLLITVITFYLLIARSFFNTWLAVFNQDPILSPEERFLVAILIVSTVLWPIIVPIAYLELISKNQNTLPE